MKRILSIITLVTMFFSFTVHAQNANDNKYKIDLSGYDNFIQMLSDIGVEMPELELDSGLKKGDYTRSLISFFGYATTYENGAYDADIDLVYALGWITQSEKTGFNPEANVTLGEATRMLVKALGYAQIMHTYNDEQSYYNEATSLGLVAGITSDWSSPISYAQMLKMFYNTLDVKMLIKETNGFSEGESMLFEVHDTELIKGIVTANNQTGIAGAACGNESIEIDGIVYECTDESAQLFLGKAVYALVRDDVILHVCENTKKNKVTVIVGDDIEEFTSLRQIKYLNENDKVKDLDFEYPPTVIVNGSLKSISNVSELEELVAQNGELEAIDNDGDNNYEILKVTNYITYVVDMINYSKGIIIDNHIKETVELSPDDYKLTVIKDGEVAKFTDIVTGDVIEISADREKVTDSGERVIDYKNCEHVTIIASNRSVGGMINSFDEETVTIDGSKIEFSDYFNNALKNGFIEDIRSGMSGAFYTNHIGKLVYVNTASHVMDQYGFLIWGGYLFEKGDVSMRIYTSEGTVENFELAKRVEVDGRSYGANEQIIGLKQLFINDGGSNKVKNQLVIYRLNEDNQISYIDTAHMGDNENKDVSLRMDVEFYGAGTASEKLLTNGKYNSYGNVYTSGAYKNVSIKGDNEKLFVVSGFENKAAHDSMLVADASSVSSNFEVTTSSYFGTGDYMFDNNNCIMFYNVGDDNTSSCMVYYNPLLSADSIPEVSNSSNVAFYAGSGTTLNKNDEVTDYIKVYLPGENEMKTLVCRNDEVMKPENIETTSYDGGGTLKNGDIIRYKLAANGEVAAIKRDVDFATMYASVQAGKEPACFDAPTDIGSPANYETLVRWLGTKSTTYFTLMSRKTNWSDLSISEAAESPMNRAAFKGTEEVLIYDVQTDEFINGTLQDLFAANECGEDASILYVRHTVSNASIILAYNFI